MKYTVEMIVDAMIYIYTKFHKDWFSHSKVDRDTHTHTDSMVMT
jgi:hypothetical protein